MNVAAALYVCIKANAVTHLCLSVLDTLNWDPGCGIALLAVHGFFRECFKTEGAAEKDMEQKGGREGEEEKGTRAQKRRRRDEEKGRLECALPALSFALGHHSINGVCVCIHVLQRNFCVGRKEVPRCIA